jgi:hypothetical protein
LNEPTGVRAALATTIALDEADMDISRNEQVRRRKSPAMTSNVSCPFRSPSQISGASSVVAEIVSRSAKGRHVAQQIIGLPAGVCDAALHKPL